MRRSFAAQWIATLVVASLVTLPGVAAAQGQQAPPATAQSPAPQATPPPDQTPPAQAPVTQTPGGQASTSQSPTVTQQDSPNVKSGSEADVNAIGNRKVGHGPEMYSLEHDIAIGKQLSQEVEKSAKFINDPVINEYVNRVGQNLVRNSDAQVPFTIKVIDSDVVNAFALPGGFFYVNSGLILHADEESELAGVMAHEIAHVCARHGTREETKSTIVQLASIPAMIFIPYSWAGYAIYQGMNFAIPLTFLKFSRGDEAEADYLGLQYMYKAGYDPNSFVSFFEKVQADEKKQPGTIPKVFSTHPPTPDRIEAIQKEIATILPARDQYIVTTSEFDTVKARLQLIEANIKVKDSNPNKPTLRKRTAQNKGGNTSPNDPNGGSNGGNTTSTPSSDPSSDDSDRPTLQHRTTDPDQQQPQQ
ncbi:MAG TPA: M48 family metalloprotease [Candidatus Cybelea sp.]|jgi:beta-barrel assembly-enhancing protease|nr:M48 family metalloprotease [Candidatus Cybelea sp.]